MIEVEVGQILHNTFNMSHWQPSTFQHRTPLDFHSSATHGHAFKLTQKKVLLLLVLVITCSFH